MRVLSITAVILPVLISFIFILDANIILYISDALRYNPPSLESTFGQKRIIISGASSGIGASIAHQLCTQTSAHLILVARRRDKLEELATTCPDRSSIAILPLDVTTNIDEIVTQSGDVDILILNAGRFSEVSALEESTTQLKGIIDLNLISSINLATSIMKHNRWEEKKKGHIVVTSSLAGKLGTPISASYAASKHALHGYFASMRAEYSPWLRIDIVCPGPVATDIFSLSNRPEDKKSIVQVPGTMMSTKRATRLILSTMMGKPVFLFRETWICKYLSLMVVYLGTYTPNLYGFVSVIMDPIIMKNYHNGDGFGFEFLDPAYWKGGETL